MVVIAGRRVLAVSRPLAAWWSRDIAPPSLVVRHGAANSCLISANASGADIAVGASPRTRITRARQPPPPESGAAGHAPVGGSRRLRPVTYRAFNGGELLCGSGVV
jgi:hypothetical protein